MASEWVWYGASGTAYQFGVWAKTANWNNVPGIYIFAGQARVSAFSIKTAAYIGQCSSFSERVCGHERWAEATLYGATEVHALVVRDQFARNSIERDLISGLRPPLNSHFTGLLWP